MKIRTMAVGELCPSIIYNVVDVEIVNGIRFFITDEDHDGEQNPIPIGERVEL